MLGLAAVASTNTLGAEPGLTMHCRALPPLAAEVSVADSQAEQNFCNIDLGSASTAVCAKTWSTSPAALIYDIEGTEWAGRSKAFEAEVCPRGGHAWDAARAELAIFKNSLNGRETSGTFAPASLLYYHFSRLLDTSVHVPVAVLAEFPLAPYHQKVVVPGLELSVKGRLKMLHAGWQEMELALSDPPAYGNRRELITEDGKLWGVLLLLEGRRYGPEVNGTRESGWGDGQNRDFQRTAPFLALRKDLPLPEAIAAAVTEARENPAMAEAVPEDISPVQVAWWMNELTEIVILDVLLKQQDRIGNIDYLTRWVWYEDSEARMSATKPEGEEAVKLKVSVLNDNDAGVRSGYANYASRTGMLDGWHHMNEGLYHRVQALAADFASEGPVATAVRANYRLSKRESEGIIERGIAIGDSLRQRHQAGELRFDLGLKF